MIHSVIILVAIFVCAFLFKELAKTLRSSGYNSAADSASELECRLSEKTDEIISQSRSAVTDFMNPEKLDMFIKSQLDRLNSVSSVKKTNEDYSYIITEDFDHPFQISPEIASRAEILVVGKETKKAKAEAMFQWFQVHFPYDNDQRDRIVKKIKTIYRHSREVWNDKKGVCGELSVLLIVMLRHVGVKARYVSVEIDQNGKKVNHACVYACLDQEDVLIDPAYHTFGAKHENYKILSDMEAVPHFKGMR